MKRLKVWFDTIMMNLAVKFWVLREKFILNVAEDTGGGDEGFHCQRPNSEMVITLRSNRKQ